jgi:hypothetical protein
MKIVRAGQLSKMKQARAKNAEISRKAGRPSIRLLQGGGPGLGKRNAGNLITVKVAPSRSGPKQVQRNKNSGKDDGDWK